MSHEDPLAASIWFVTLSRDCPSGVLQEWFGARLAGFVFAVWADQDEAI